MVKIQESRGQYFISIPKIVIKKKDWKKGQELFPSFNENGDLVLEEV